MSSRGAVIKNGHVTPDEYDIVRSVYDASVLIGKTKQQHGLPDYSHTPNRKYIKENPNGTFREMRVYDSECNPIIEIGYHPEPKITGNRHENVLHYHTFSSDLSRHMGGELSKSQTPELYEKYAKYLKEYGL